MREQVISSSQEGRPEEEAIIYRQLKEEMKAYNQRIYEDRQRGLVEAWSYEQSGISMEGYSDQDAIGYLQIDKMGIRIPVYLGASKENMAKGVTVLGQTSMPIGGINTNCVIAAHRGTPMFRDIELLEIGDRAILSNLWDTLIYEVYKIEVILPNQIDKIKVQEGKELLTLLTCHPYSQNYQRYVVYLRRIDENSSSSTAPREDEKNQEETEGDTAVKLDISSQETIRKEQILTNTRNNSDDCDDSCYPDRMGGFSL